jgi:hypothetical protein
MDEHRMRVFENSFLENVHVIQRNDKRTLKKIT